MVPICKRLVFATCPLERNTRTRDKQPNYPMFFLFVSFSPDHSHLFRMLGGGSIYLFPKVKNGHSALSKKPFCFQDLNMQGFDLHRMVYVLPGKTESAM